MDLVTPSGNANYFLKIPLSVFISARKQGHNPAIFEQTLSVLSSTCPAKWLNAKLYRDILSLLFLTYLCI